MSNFPKTNQLNAIETSLPVDARLDGSEVHVKTPCFNSSSLAVIAPSRPCMLQDGHSITQPSSLMFDGENVQKNYREVHYVPASIIMRNIEGWIQDQNNSD